jgi:hypothetical protein
LADSTNNTEQNGLEKTLDAIVLSLEEMKASQKKMHAALKILVDDFVPETTKVLVHITKDLGKIKTELKLN